jgi:subtilisin family serine protease
MIRRAALVAMVAIALPQLGAPDGAASTVRAAADEPRVVPGEIIVRFRAGVASGRRNQLLADVGARTKVELTRIQARLVKVDPNKLSASLKRLQSSSLVRYAEPNYVVSALDHGNAPSDPFLHELWGLRNFGQTVNGVTGVGDADADATEAWGIPNGSGNVVVAVTDTGVDFGHPDLGGSMETSPLMWTNPGESCPGCRTNRTDDDGNGYVDDWRGWDFRNNDNNPFDDHGHGTHVAGTIAAIGNNGIGVVGVAGLNPRVKLMGLKFLSAEGYGSAANAVRAILYASAKGAHVQSNSWGSYTFSQAVLDAVKDADTKGSLFVAAAGNYGENSDDDYWLMYPAGYDVANVLSVAATDSMDRLAPFSNYGRRSVDLGAPGASVYSTWPGGTYRFLSGTSMATPHVSGAAALAKSLFPSLSHLQLKALLLDSVEATGLVPEVKSEGRLNVDRALRCANPAKVWIETPGPGFAAAVGKPLAIRVIAASCAPGSAPSVNVHAAGLPIPLTPKPGGIYEGSVTPADSGPLHVLAWTTSGAAKSTRTVRGRAEREYRVEDAPYSWIDAGNGGTNTGMKYTHEMRETTVPLPFPFSFYGETFSEVTISKNGFLAFGKQPENVLDWMALNWPIPFAFPPNGIVAPFWDDLHPQGAIFYRTIGTAPRPPLPGAKPPPGQRRFVVSWGYGDGKLSLAPTGVLACLWSGCYPDWGRFQVILEEGTNDIVFQYADLDFGHAWANDGASATVGVENPDGTAGTMFSYHSTVLRPYVGTKALRFTTSPATQVDPPAPSPIDPLPIPKDPRGPKP